MDKFFAYVRKHKAEIISEFRDALAFCTTLASDIDGSGLPDSVGEALSVAEPDYRDYAISSAYALLMETEQRKALSAYFTPPELTKAVLERNPIMLRSIRRR